MELKFRISDEGIRKFFSGARDSHRDAPAKFRRGAIAILLIGLCFIVLIGGWKWFRTHREEASRAAELAAGPRVETAKVVQSKPEYTVTVIGEARPFAEVTLYAKVSGYLKEVVVDKGDHVKKNQKLAVIESPETDKDYNAVAADAKNKGRISDRMKKLAQRELVSAQEVEQAQSDAEVSQAKLESLQVLKNYETLRAPFDGVVTARYADAGSLVQNAANSQTSALPLVTVSQLDQLRIYVYLDQKDARYVRVGDIVDITMPDRPGFKLAAKVTRQSGSLDEKTRMLLTEADVDNTKGDIVPGSYVQVGVHVHRPAFLQVPISALVLREGKSFVPVITPEDNTIHFHEVDVADNDGRTLGIRGGVAADQLLALNVGPMPDGAKIRPVAVASPSPGPAGPAGPAPGASPVVGSAPGVAPGLTAGVPSGNVPTNMPVPSTLPTPLSTAPAGAGAPK